MTAFFQFYWGFDTFHIFFARKGYLPNSIKNFALLVVFNLSRAGVRFPTRNISIDLTRFSRPTF